MEKGNNTDVFFNIITFANNPKLWEEKKIIMLNILNKKLKQKEFIEKHLMENFKNLIPVVNLFNSIHNILGYKSIEDYQNQNYKLILIIDFIKRKDFKINSYEIEVKLKDVKSNFKVINKKELKTIFNELLYRIGYEIGYVQGMIDRIDLDMKILRNEKESLVIKENIQDIQKIFFDYVCSIVKENNNLYNYLFPFLNYCLENQIVTTQNKFFEYIADVTGNKKDFKAIKKTFLLNKKNKKIPKLW